MIHFVSCILTRQIITYKLLSSVQLYLLYKEFTKEFIVTMFILIQIYLTDIKMI